MEYLVKQAARARLVNKHGNNVSARLPVVTQKTVGEHQGNALGTKERKGQAIEDTLGSCKGQP